MDGHQFDLVDQKWIPVTRDGQPNLAPLRECMLKASEIDGLAIDAPLETVAVLRQVLLPIHLWILDHNAKLRLDSLDAWAQLWAARPDDPLRRMYNHDVERYLVKQRGAFDLFGPRPFGQVAGLHTSKGDTKPVSILIASAASGNNVPLFSARTEADPPALRPDEAVRALLATHCWDTAGIKTGMVDDPQAKAGKTTGNQTGPLGAIGVVVPVGRTLWETLLLNTRILPHGLRQLDSSQWHKPATPEWRARADNGLLDLLTWQSRRIRLIPEVGPDSATVVRRVLVGAGDRLSVPPLDTELHTAWKLSGAKGKQEQRPVRHVPGRAAWRGLSSLLAAADTTTPPILLGQLGDLQVEELINVDYPLQVLTVGVEYGTQSAVVEDTMADTIPLPLLALSPAPDNEVRRLLNQIVDQAEALRQAANGLQNNLRLAMAGDKLPWDQGQHLGDLLVHRFNPVVRRLLAGLQREPQRYAEADLAWRRSARRLALDIAEPMLDHASRRAFVGRKVSEKVTYRAATAESWYRAEIFKVLGKFEPATAGGV